MRTCIGMVMVVACVGCATEAKDGWTGASPELQAQGVHAIRVLEDAVREIVLLRGADAQQIGELTLETRPEQRTLTLELRGVIWSQTVRPEEREIELRLGDRRATLALDDAGGEATALLRDAAPYIELGRLIAVEANLGTPPIMPVGAASPNKGAPTPPPAPPTSASPVDGGGDAICCSTVVVVGSAWAWYWEKSAQSLACVRASDNVEASCKVASAGLRCCQLADPCTSCVDWGTGYYCSTAGYLQYRC